MNTKIFENIFNTINNSMKKYLKSKRMGSVCKYIIYAIIQIMMLIEFIEVNIMNLKEFSEKTENFKKVTSNVDLFQIEKNIVDFSEIKIELQYKKYLNNIDREHIQKMAREIKKIRSL